MGAPASGIPRLHSPTLAATKIADDLGIDSLTMMEIVMLAEEVLQLTIASEELCRLRTLDDAQQFIAAKVRGDPAPAPFDPGAANRPPTPAPPVRLSSNR